MPVGIFVIHRLVRAISGSPFEASYLPFPKTAADRQKTGDPRKSIAERYANREEYLTRYAAAIDDLVQQRWVLPEDRAALAASRPAGVDRKERTE